MLVIPIIVLLTKQAQCYVPGFWLGIRLHVRETVADGLAKFLIRPHCIMGTMFPLRPAMSYCFYKDPKE